MPRTNSDTGFPCVYKSGRKFRVTMNTGEKPEYYALNDKTYYRKRTFGPFDTIEEAIEIYEEEKERIREEKEQARIETRVSAGLSAYPKKRTNKSCASKGVTYIARRDRYLASMTVNRKWIYVGTYKTEAEARASYIEARKERGLDY